MEIVQIRIVINCNYRDMTVVIVTWIENWSVTGILHFKGVSLSDESNPLFTFL